MNKLHLLASIAAILSMGHFASIAQEPAPAGGAATAPAAATKPMTPADKKFVKDTAASMYFEMRVAELTKTNGSAPTKTYGELLSKDLNKAWEALAAIAKANNEMMPAELAGPDKGAVERLKKMKDQAFERQFYRDVQKEAKHLERDFETASKSATDPELKSFATNYLAVVKNHVTEGDKAEKEAAKVKK